MNTLEKAKNKLQENGFLDIEPPRQPAHQPPPYETDGKKEP